MSQQYMYYPSLTRGRETRLRIDRGGNKPQNKGKLNSSNFTAAVASRGRKASCASCPKTKSSGSNTTGQKKPCQKPAPKPCSPKPQSDNKIQQIGENDLIANVFLRPNVDVLDITTDDCVVVPFGLNDSDVWVNTPAILKSDQCSEKQLPWDFENSAYKILEKGMYEFKTDVTVSANLPEFAEEGDFLLTSYNYEIVLEQFDPECPSDSVPLAVSGKFTNTTVNDGTTISMNEFTIHANTATLIYKAYTRPTIADDANDEEIAEYEEKYPLNRFLRVGNSVRVLFRKKENNPFVDFRDVSITGVSGIEYQSTDCTLEDECKGEKSQQLYDALEAPMTTFEAKRILTTGITNLNCGGKNDKSKSGCVIKQCIERSDLNVAVSESIPTADIHNNPSYHCLGLSYGSSIEDQFINEGAQYDVERSNQCQSLVTGPKVTLACPPQSTEGGCGCEQESPDKKCKCSVEKPWQHFQNGYKILKDGTYAFKIMFSQTITDTPLTPDYEYAGETMNNVVILSALDPITKRSRTLKIGSFNTSSLVSGLPYLKSGYIDFMSKTGKEDYDLRVGEIVTLFISRQSEIADELVNIDIMIGGTAPGCSNNSDLEGFSAIFTAQRLGVY